MQYLAEHIEYIQQKTAESNSYDFHEVETFGQIVDFIEELSTEYEIPFEDALDQAEFALSYALSEKLNIDIQVYLRQNCRILGFSDNKAFKIRPKQIPKDAIAYAKDFLRYRFLCLNAQRILYDAKKLTRTVVTGTIKRIIEKNLYVKFQNPHAMTEGGRVLIGICPLEHQTPKERGVYREGMILPFFVTSVRGIIENEMPKVVITLSRNSISFPEALLRQLLQDNGIFIELKTVRRIAGAYAVIHASEKVPKEYIKKVTEILKEGVIVKY